MVAGWQLTLRVAIHITSDLGLRAGRFLAAEQNVGSIGILGDERLSGDEAHRISTPFGWDVLVVDTAPTPTHLSWSGAEGLMLVTPAPNPTPTPNLITGADVRFGLAGALARRVQGTGEVEVGYTDTSFDAQSRGHALPFPDPIGPQWCSETKNADPSTGFRWYRTQQRDSIVGLVARTGIGEGEVVLGIVDDDSFLAGIALGGAAVVGYQTGPHPSGASAASLDGYLEACALGGLEIGAFSASSGPLPG